jgi:hypothetical protein
MILAAHQPQYLPWMGYLDKISKADVFLILDDVQYKKNEWQNRNRIKSPNGPQWITVPVRYRFPQLIREVAIDIRSPWSRKHREALRSSYARTPHFDEVMSAISFVWENPEPWAWLWELNLRVIRAFMDLAGIQTPLHLSSDHPLPEDPNQRLIEACRIFNADKYLAGAGGADYMDLSLFEESGVGVQLQQFESPRYEQVFGEFIPNLSAVDYFFHCGPAASFARLGEQRKES